MCFLFIFKNIFVQCLYYEISLDLILSLRICRKETQYYLVLIRKNNLGLVLANKAH